MASNHPTDPTALTAGILIVSTTASQGSTSDHTTPLLKEVFEHANQTKTSSSAPDWHVRSTAIVSDDAKAITEVIKTWTDNHGQRLDLVVTSGGTGFAETDCTPEAISALLHRQAPGLVHAMLAASLGITPFAAMSRPVAGSRNKTVIVTLPGSPKGAKENLESIIKLLPHACIQNSGLQDSRKLHAGGTKKLEAEAGISTTSSESIKQSGHHSCGGHHHRHHHHHHATPAPHTKPSNEPGTNVTHRHRFSPYPMITVDKAHALISENTPTPVVEYRAVNPSLVGYILAEDVTAKEPVPAYRASIVDGYAVIGADGPGVYPVVTVSHAAPGDDQLPTLQHGQIARITTGAPVPPGADAVVMVEDTKLISATDDGKEEREVEILASDMKPDENIRQIGSDVALGSLILSKGTEITAVGGEIGLLRSVGVNSVKVYSKPVIGVLSTGDEVVDHNQPLKMGEIRDTNRPTLLAAISAQGFLTMDLGIVKDKATSLADNLKSALDRVDVIISTGGVSMGELDLLKPTIEHTLDGTIHFGRVAMKPGKPTTFATIPSPSPLLLPPPSSSSENPPVSLPSSTYDKKLIFALPGNPASALVTFHIFVLPSLRKLAGYQRSRHHLPKVSAVLSHDIHLDPRPEYHRAMVRFDTKTGRLVAESTGGQRSSRIGSLLGANALLCMPALSDENLGEKRKARGTVPAGERVDAVLIGQIVGM